MAGGCGQHLKGTNAMQVRYRSRAAAHHLLPALRSWSWPRLVTGLAMVLAALIIPIAAAAVNAAAGPAAAHARQQGKAVPVAALASVSRALGRDDPAYQATMTARGLTAVNPRQRLRAQFTSGGLRIRSGPLAVGLGLRGIGFGPRLTAVPPATTVAAGNQVTFRHGPVREWYTNGPLGLEQSFTLTAPPPGPAGGPLTLAMALSGNARATLSPSHAGVVFSRAGSALAYQGLTVSDAHGTRLPAWLTLAGRQLLLHIQANGARYPLTVDPVIQQARLTASDAAPGDSLGASVAISGNGTTIIAGSAATINGNTAQGAVYVFTKPLAGWQDATQTAKLTASDGAAFDFLGSFFTGDANSVAISTDGNTIVAGAPGNWDGAPGAVYVFTKPTGGWHNETQAAKLTAADAGPGDNLGATVAISANTIAAGAPEATINGNQLQGAAYIFTKPTTGWHNETQAAKLTATDGAQGDTLGGALAMSGTTVVAAAAGATVNGNQTEGAAYVFTKPGTGWQDETQAAKLTASDGLPFELFGNSAAMSGRVIMIGTDSPDFGGNPGLGAAYIFAEPAGGWHDMTQTAKLTASPNAPGTLLGYSVALFGRTAMAGGNGAIWVFAEPPGGWHDMTQTAMLTNPDFLGYMEALSPTTLAAAAPFAGTAGQGVVDVYPYTTSGIRQLAATQATMPVPPHTTAPCPAPARPGAPPHPLRWPAPVSRAHCR
jgi:hypothetical protein